MNYRNFVGIAVLLAMSVSTAHGAMRSGGILGNSYASEMLALTGSTMLLTTRKKVTGDIREINIPGSKVYNAFEKVKAAAVLRAAIEARNLGFRFFSVSGYRDLTRIMEKRSASKDLGGGVPETSFVFAYGHFTNDVEVALELTIQLSNSVSVDANDDVDVAQVLAANGI